MSKIAIFIDGGYLGNLCKRHFKIGSGADCINYEKFVRWIAGSSQVFRSYYYDCLPYQPANPNLRERNAF